MGCQAMAWERLLVSDRAGGKARVSTAAPWPAGTTIVVQEVWRGRLWSVRPVMVVVDCGGFLALWCPRGTRWKTATTPPTRLRAATRAERFVASLTLSDWILGDFGWDVATLALLHAGDWHAVWVSWRETGESWGWYVNLQRPFHRTERTLQTMDLMLDILVAPDRQWHWKDEDEFAALVAAGLITTAEAAWVREEAQRVIERVAADAPPFNEPWHDWRPNPRWSVPELPEGWDQL